MTNLYEWPILMDWYVSTTSSFTATPEAWRTEGVGDAMSPCGGLKGAKEAARRREKGDKRGAERATVRWIFVSGKKEKPLCFVLPLPRPAATRRLCTVAVSSYTGETPWSSRRE